MHPAPPPAVAPARRRRGPLLPTLVLALLIGVGGTWGVLRAAEERTDSVVRVEGLDLDVDDGPAENFLLVGSDTREGVDLSGADAGGIGTTADVTGQRADTIMILRRERDGGAALVSLPRDLWLPIAGTGRSNRINSAYNDGAPQLASTVTQALGIPVHHYVEVDFQGFKDIINAIGGVDLCVEHATRDLNTGLSLQPGCPQTLNGEQALAFARSRRYEEFREGDWRQDPTADLGRIARQQLFMRAAVDGALRTWQSSPLSSGDLIQAVVDSVRIDATLDPFEGAEALRRAATDGLTTYQLPVVGRTIDGQAVLELDEGANAILDYFRGVAPAPPPTS